MAVAVAMARARATTNLAELTQLAITQLLAQLLAIVAANRCAFLQFVVVVVVVVVECYIQTVTLETRRLASS